MIRPLVLSLSAAAILAAPMASAQDRMMQTAVAARKGHMQHYQLMLTVLGGMAKGDIEYDADSAQAAADNIVKMTQIDQRFYWPAGSDSSSIEGTRAKAEIWQNFDDVISKAVAFNEAAVALASAAGSGAEALGPAIGGVGQACTACHDSYRAE